MRGRVVHDLLPKHARLLAPPAALLELRPHRGHAVGELVALKLELLERAQRGPGPRATGRGSRGGDRLQGELHAHHPAELGFEPGDLIAQRGTCAARVELAIRE